MFFRLDADLRSLDQRQEQLDRRQEQLDRQLKAVMAFGWDHVAMARRLAALEDHVDKLLSRGAASAPVAPASGESRTSIRYPGPEEEWAQEPRHIIPPRSKVS
jgi:hypothetical protein